MISLEALAPDDIRRGIERSRELALSEAGISYKVDDGDFLALSGLPGVRPAPYLARARWVQVISLEA
ncbi:hypothetical protein ABD440_21540, partial [Chromobacterium piscinae]